MKFQVYIVEDQKEHFELVSDVLSGMEGVKVINTYLGTKYPYNKSVEQIKARRPNLIVIDHELNDPEKTGLDLFMEINSPQVFVIFYSQFPEKARENDSAFSNAKFIEKTPNSEKLKNRLEMVMVAVRDYFSKYPEAYRLVIRVENIERVINASSISYIKADGDHSIIYLENESKGHLSKISLGDLYKRYSLRELGFLPVNRSHIVNQFKISSVRRDNSLFSKFKVVLSVSAYKMQDITLGEKYYNEPAIRPYLDLLKK